MSINHINLGVADVKRTADYYAAVLGGRVQANPVPSAETLYFPGARPGFGMWASLGSSGGASRKGIDGWDGTPGVVTHVGYGVTMPNTEFPGIAAEVKKRFPDTKDASLFKTEAAGQECMLFDPDGIAFQLIPLEHNGTLKGYSKETGKKLTGADGPPDKMLSAPAEKSTAIAPAMSINHLSIYVRDLKRSMEYYSAVLGAKPYATWTRTGPMYIMALPGQHNGFGCSLSINQVNEPTPTGYHHVAFGVDPKTDLEKIAAEITQRFPVDKQKFPNKKDPSVYKMAKVWPGMDVFDPDGINFQLFQIGYDGSL
jgi:catechol 2,3-dioxygenase-like lactoylglutathione lyase family enzyme